MAPIVNFIENELNIICKAIALVLSEDKVNMKLLQVLTTKELLCYSEICNNILQGPEMLQKHINNGDTVLVEYVLNCSGDNYNYAMLNHNLEHMPFDETYFNTHATDMVKIITDKAMENYQRYMSGLFPTHNMLVVLKYACKWEVVPLINYIISLRPIKVHFSNDDAVKYFIINELSHCTLKIKNLFNLRGYKKIDKLSDHLKYAVMVEDDIYTFDDPKDFTSIIVDFKDKCISLIVPIVNNNMLLNATFPTPEIRVLGCFGVYNILDFAPKDLNEYYYVLHKNEMMNETDETFINGYDKMVRMIFIKDITEDKLKKYNINW